MIVLAPGHSHASAVFAQPLANVSDQVHVYGPAGPETDAFLASLNAFNNRRDHPTHWKVEPYVGPDFLTRLKQEPAGNIVVVSGRNNRKIQLIVESLRAGQNVLADKPLIINKQDLPLLEGALNSARKQHLAVDDGMTERFNVAYRLQRALLKDADVFGSPLPGTAAKPAVELENLHSLVKYDHGKINLRPAWFFDVRQQGEGISDVGTHLVDLEFWTLFPDQPIEYRRDIHLLRASHTPVIMTGPQFERVSGEKPWPTFLQSEVRDGNLYYYSNSSALFTLRGIYTAIRDRWEYESVGALTDSYLVLYRGSKSTIRVRQSKLENYVPELDVIPNAPGQRADVRAALQRRIAALFADFPHLGLRENEGGFRILIPTEDRRRGGAGFEGLVAQFLGYVADPARIPAWELPNLLAKYALTTEAAALAQKTSK